MTKLKVDVQNGVLEIEGEESLVREIYEDFKKQLAEVTLSRKIPPVIEPKKTISPMSGDLISFSSLAECLGQIPRDLTDVERSLVAAGYIQLKNEAEAFGSQEVNKQLNHAGFKIANITRALDGNIGTKPQRIIQLKKTGSAKQARKEYKVTTEGFKAIKSFFINEVAEI